MDLLKKNVALLLAAVFCLGLTACGGGNDEPDAPVVGNDWRVTGVVRGSGTITHEGEGSVDVLVTVDENSAAFYRDEPEQILFDSVSFPMEIPGAQEYFNDISFDDINGDGESDVSISFVYAPGNSTALIWIWDPEERYVFREDLSVLNADSGEIGDYVGLWERVGGDFWLGIYEYEVWEFLDDQGIVAASGSLRMNETGIELYLDDTGDVVMQLERTVSGDLIDSESGGLFVTADSLPSNNSGGSAVPSDNTSSNNSGGFSDYVGLWKCEDEDVWLRIYESEDWEFFNDQEVATSFGLLRMDGTSVELYFDDTGDVVLKLERTASGNLVDSLSGGVLVPVDSIQSR